MSFENEIEEDQVINYINEFVISSQDDDQPSTKFWIGAFNIQLGEVEQNGSNNFTSVSAFKWLHPTLDSYSNYSNFGISSSMNIGNVSSDVICGFYNLEHEIWKIENCSIPLPNSYFFGCQQYKHSTSIYVSNEKGSDSTCSLDKYLGSNSPCKSISGAQIALDLSIDLLNYQLLSITFLESGIYTISDQPRYCISFSSTI